MSEELSKGPAFAKKRDFIILGVLLALLALLTLWFYVIGPKLSKNDEIWYAWIYYENDVIEKVKLDGTPRRWKLDVPGKGQSGDEVDIIVETFSDKSIAVVDSNCPDHICVHTGRIYRPGQSIACLPNRVIIKIGTKEGPEEAGLDG